MEEIKQQLKDFIVSELGVDADEYVVVEPGRRFIEHAKQLSNDRNQSILFINSIFINKVIYYSTARFYMTMIKVCLKKYSEKKFRPKK